MRLAGNIWRVINGVFRRIGQDRVLEWAAQFSFYLMLALFPFLALLTNVAAQTRLFGVDMLAQLADILPAAAFDVVMGVVRDITATQKPGVLSVSMIVALWASSTGVFALSKGLNMAHRAKETRNPWVVRGWCLLFILLIVLSIFTEVLLILFGDYILEKMATLFHVSTPFLLIGQMLRVVLPVGVVFFTLSLMYRLIPAHRLRLRQVMPGALFSTVSWLGTSWLFSLYVSRFANYSRFYGSLGGVIILMIWIYLSSITLLMGSEVNALLERIAKAEETKGAPGNANDPAAVSITKKKLPDS